MASKNSIKVYLKNGFYHIYNRGVEKRDIFCDQQDFSVFVTYLKNYLLFKDEDALNRMFTSPESTSLEKQKIIKQLGLKNFFNKIDLLAYSLLPNHFHLLVKQNDENDIDSFMNAIGTRYASYFNRRYKRVGPLYQGVYKAVLVETDEQLLHLSRYIHLNPFHYQNLRFSSWNQINWPCSLPNYLGIRNEGWVKTDFILSYFSKINSNFSYADFVSSSFDESRIASFYLETET
ncbi:MAG: transposase [Patescibacteria group bacterium]